ncbi:MAG: AAA family ATPase [Planctomycetota bacterium]
MQRICVIGPCGAGKSTFARALGERLGLPGVHMDRLQWKPGWVESSREELERQLCEVLAEPRWVIDGNYSGTMPMRFARADTVVFLDLPRWVCRWRVIKRTVLGWRRTRWDMNRGCPERLEWEFLVYVWRFHRDARPRILERLADLPEGVELITLCHRQEVREFLASVGRAR